MVVNLNASTPHTLKADRNTYKMSYKSEFGEKMQRIINKDGLLKLMYDRVQLDYYFDNLVVCLRNEKIFPPHPSIDDHEHQCIHRAEQTITAIRQSNVVVYKQAFVFMGLRICQSFVNMLAPNPTKIIPLQRRQVFLVDPDKLVLFTRGKKPRLGYQLSRYLGAAALFSVHDFVTNCIVDWMCMCPWLNHEQWSELSPNSTSFELLKAKDSHTGMLTNGDHQYMEIDN